MLETKEIRAIAQKVVDKARATANVDTGFLRRSIYYTYVREVVTFRQAYYGVFKNSKLEQYAKQMMPKGVAWLIVLVNDDGTVFTQKGQTAGGRGIGKEAILKSNKQNTKNIYNLIKLLRIGKAKDAAAVAS